jgi:hypothetical protein
MTILFLRRYLAVHLTRPLTPTMPAVTVCSGPKGLTWLLFVLWFVLPLLPFFLVLTFTV